MIITRAWWNQCEEILDSEMDNETTKYVWSCLYVYKFCLSLKVVVMWKLTKWLLPKSSPGFLTWAAIGLPLSYNNQTSTGPHNPLYVLHRWYWMPMCSTSRELWVGCWLSCLVVEYWQLRLSRSSGFNADFLLPLFLLHNKIFFVSIVCIPVVLAIKLEVCVIKLVLPYYNALSGKDKPICHLNWHWSCAVHP